MTGLSRPKRTRLTLALVGLAAVGAGAGLAASRAAAAQPRNPSVPEPARLVDIASYAGRWHEMARYENRFERGCDGVTADYGLRSDGLISVTNVCQPPGGGGTRVARGRAKIVPGSGGAKLKVSFFGPFFVGDYWVLDRAEDYSWAIVGEPSGRYLWILTREAAPSPLLRDDLLRRAAAMGYDRDAIRLGRPPSA